VTTDLSAIPVKGGRLYRPPQTPISGVKLASSKLSVGTIQAALPYPS